LWVAFEANLGTLLRTCDAVGACMAVPDSPHYRAALAKGDTLSRRPCIHWLDRPRERWLDAQRAAGWRIVAVELAGGAVALPRLEPARERTLVLLGHEWHGIPEAIVEEVDACVEIPLPRPPAAAGFAGPRPAASSPLRSWGSAPASTWPSPARSCSIA
jgi:tRNA G18 (ribose-2'-O)-methylase SpoU